MELKADFGADSQVGLGALHNEVVAAGAVDLYAWWRLEAERVAVLAADREDAAPDGASVGDLGLGPQGRLCQRAPGLRGFLLQFDNLGDQRDGICVQPVERAAVKGLAAQQDGLSEA